MLTKPGIFHRLKKLWDTSGFYLFITIPPIQSIPLPAPNAQGPHTVLGGKISSKTGLPYRQSATFPEGTWPTANGKNVPWSEVHWGDHGTPEYHANPHQHEFIYDFVQRTWKRQKPTNFY